MQKHCYKKSANFFLPPNFPLLIIVDDKSKSNVFNGGKKNKNCCDFEFCIL